MLPNRTGATATVNVTVADYRALAVGATFRPTNAIAMFAYRKTVIGVTALTRTPGGAFLGAEVIVFVIHTDIGWVPTAASHCTADNAVATRHTHVDFVPANARSAVLASRAGATHWLKRAVVAICKVQFTFGTTGELTPSKTKVKARSPAKL